MSAIALKSTKRRFSSLNHQNFEFFRLVPRSPTHTCLICGKTLELNISPVSKLYSKTKVYKQTNSYCQQFIFFCSLYNDKFFLTVLPCRLDNMESKLSDKRWRCPATNTCSGQWNVKISQNGIWQAASVPIFGGSQQNTPQFVVL